MNGSEALLAALVDGALTSALPCVLVAVPVAVGFVGGQSVTPWRGWVLALAFVAGMTAALLVMGLMAARLGMLLGTLPGPWPVGVGVFVAAAAV